MFWNIVGGIVALSLICAAVTFLREIAPLFIKLVLSGVALEVALLAICFIMKWIWIFTAMKIIGVITVLLTLGAVLIAIFKR